MASSSARAASIRACLPNLLVEGVAATIYGVNAVRIYVANLMTEPGETDHYTLDDHLRAIRTHTGFDLFDYILVNRRPIDEVAARRYAERGSEPVVAERNSSACGQRAGRRVRSGNRVGRNEDSSSSAFARARHSGVDDRRRTINTAGLIPDGNVAGDGSRSVRGFLVARHSGWLVVQFVVGALALAACGGSSSPPRNP